MIGIIICGHGQFATGIYSSMKLITGKQENIVTIDFTESMGAQKLEDKLKKAIENLKRLEEIVILTDIPGGTPFNKAALFSDKNIKVISGTNLPALLESTFYREEEIEEFIRVFTTAAKEGVKVFELQKD